MEQSFQQADQQAAADLPRRGNPLWVKGKSQNPGGRISRVELNRRVAAVMDEIAGEFGGVANLSGAERLLLRKAAELTVHPLPRKPVDRVRCINATVRAINLIRRERSNRRGKLLRLSARIGT